jgi:magnesium transporter
MVVTVGSVVGSILPLLFDHLGMDPAIMSNPLIASLSDLFGVFIYYKAATWVHH